MPDLAVIVPTRGRPGNVLKVISAWDFTNAWDHADLVLVADADDPEIQVYRDVVDRFGWGVPDDITSPLSLVEVPAWLPMVHKLNAAARDLADRYWALAFAGDDHLPQTIGWAARYLTVLRELGTGMVYGDDGHQGRKLSTEWAVTSDAVRALGRMVPADVEHMYCDNAMMDLFGGAGALRHLPEIRIEHMHPVAGKAETDEQYQRVNHRDQFKKDRRAYEKWRGSVLMSDQFDKIRHLRKGRPDVTDPNPAPRAPRTGSGPRRVERSGPSSARQPRQLRVPRHFRQVRAATPEDVMTALADFATQVPADQEIVEIGVFHGRTALQLAWGASQGNGAHVTAIDPWDLPGNVYDPPFTNPESKRWAEHWVSSLGYSDKIRLMQGFSVPVAEAWNNMRHPGAGPEFPEHKMVGLLYVDGDHTKEGAKRDIVSWAPHLAPGAVIAVDDYGHPDWPGVGEAVDELVAEGILEPIELFHDRLAVTSIRATLVNNPGATPRAITAEGVSPSPYPAAEGQVAVSQVSGSDEVDDLFGGPVNVSSGPPEGWVQNEDGNWAPPEVDSEVSTVHPGINRERTMVHAGELEGVTNGTPIGELNLVNLKALAKKRGIVLGARKDKRDLILQALKDGR
jgi:predicted O-methyltransferase YrrM